MTDPRPLIPKSSSPIKVLIVEDLPVVQEFLTHILSTDPAIEVIEAVGNGQEALDAMKRIKPDVITMDINMPKMDGFEATRRIMETDPTPIVIVTASWDPKEVETSFRAIDAGAVAILEKPRGVGHPDYENAAKDLIQTVKLMSEVKVVKRWVRPHSIAVLPHSAKVELGRIQAEIKIVAIGASTGGPLVIQTILSKLSKDFSAPVLIVQHMAAGFIHGFAEWLDQTSGLSVSVAVHGKYILPGHVYIAPDGFQMKVEKSEKIALIKDAPENGLRPSVSYLFRSVAHVYGESSAGVLLSGMGRDGSEELKLMREKGAITIAQDKESSVVYGMPGEAVKLDAATYVLPPEKIAVALNSMVNSGRKT